MPTHLLNLHVNEIGRHWSTAATTNSSPLKHCHDGGFFPAIAANRDASQTQYVWGQNKQKYILCFSAMVAMMGLTCLQGHVHVLHVSFICEQ